LNRASLDGIASKRKPFEGFCGNPDLAKVETTHNACIKRAAHKLIQSLVLVGLKQTVETGSYRLRPQREGSVNIDPKVADCGLDPETWSGRGGSTRVGVGSAELIGRLARVFGPCMAYGK